MKRNSINNGMALLIVTAALSTAVVAAHAQDKKPNIVMLMTDDTGWNDFGAYSGGGASLGHPTPNIDKMAKEGAVFTSWYGQASCTAGRASFMTGRIPIRSALSIVVAPGDENYLTPETPTIAEFFKKNGYTTYFSGKWHLGDKPVAYPTNHGFDEMKEFAAYYAGVYSYPDTTKWFHPWFPSYNADFEKMWDSVVNLSEWEGVAGQPAKKVATITYDYMATMDERQADYAVDYIKTHAKSGKPFFMDVNWIKMHNPTNAAPDFRGKSHFGDYSDSLMEMDADIGKVLDAIRQYAPNTIVILTADNGAWLDAYPDAGTTPFRGEKGSAFEGGWRVPAIMTWPGHIPAGVQYGEMMSHIDCWSTLAAMAGITPPPHGRDERQQRQADLLRQHRQQRLHPGQVAALRAQVVDLHQWRVSQCHPRRYRRRSPEPWLNIAWKFIWTAKDSWLGPTQGLGSIPAVYNLTMDPFERYDMIFNGAEGEMNGLKTSPGRYAGEDNGWTAGLFSVALVDFDKSIMKYPSIQRFPGGASTDLIPDLQHPKNPLPLLDPQNLPKAVPSGD